MMAADTPKYWKEYLDYLEQNYQVALAKWKREHDRLIRDNKKRTAFQRFLVSNETLVMEHGWNEPYRKCPKILDYYNWDVNIRGKK